MTICVTGSAAYDTVFSYRGRFCNQLSERTLTHMNVCFPAASMTRRFGGCGANIAYAVHLLGDDPVLLCALGENDAADYENHLAECGIRLYANRVAEEFTSQCVIITDATGSQIATFSSNAALFTRTDIWPENETFSVGILAPETRVSMISRVKQFAAHKVPFFFDPGQITPRFSASELLSCIEAAQYVVMSDFEFETVRRITGATVSSILKTAKALIITASEEGATVYTACGKLTVSACEVRAVDTIGAGDAFRAGVLHAVSHSLDWEKGLRLGCALASFKVEAEGAQTYRPTREDILLRIAQNYGDSEGYAL